MFFDFPKLLLLSVVSGAGVFALPAAAEPIERISVSAEGLQADGPSERAVVSATGRYVVFVSEATNLVEGDVNGFADVFLKDRQTGEVDLISVSTGGVQGDGDSGQPGGPVEPPRLSVTPDGRFVVFQSAAGNLDPQDTGPLTSLFVRDREAGTTELLSFSADGSPSSSFVSGSTAISDDGRFVVYHSVDSSFDEAGDVTFVDVLLRDREADLTTLVSVNSDGQQSAPGGSANNNRRADISADGRFVAFDTRAPNLVPDDTNEARDVFRRDLVAGETIRVSLTDDDGEADGPSTLGGMDATGRYVLFASGASNIDDDVDPGLFIRDLVEATTTRLSVAPGDPLYDAIQSGVAYGQNLSTGGRFAVFHSAADDLVDGDANEAADVLRHETTTGELTLLSDAQGGGTANGASQNAAISDDGRVVVFESAADDLVDGDTNEVRDIFATGDVLRDAHPYEYAAKVVCGNQSDDEVLALTPGRYSTVVNVHSPKGTAQFSKKLALGIPPGGQQSGEILYIAVHELGYDEVLSVDCDDLSARLFPGGFPPAEIGDAAFIDGYLVLESEAPLDVTAVYTTADRDSGHSSVDVEQIPERRRQADISVSKTVSTLGFEVTDGAEVFLALFTITVANAGPDVAPDVSLHDVVSLQVSDALAFVAFVLGDPNLITLPPGASVTGSTIASATTSTLDIELGDLDPGEAVLVAFWAVGQILTVGFDDPSVVLRDTVSVTSAGLDPAAGNGTSMVQAVLVP